MSPARGTEKYQGRIYSPERLRQHLNASDLTRPDLARELGLSENYVFRICSGNRRITEQLARAIAYTLDIEIIDLMEVDDHVPIEAQEVQGVSGGPGIDPAGVSQAGRHPCEHALQD